MLRLWSALAVLITAFTLAKAQVSKLPEPPTGFQWQQLPELKAAFLKPEGWHVKHRAEGETQAYFITLEDLDKQGTFLTGLSVNSIPKVSAQTKLWAKQCARQLHERVKLDSTVTILKEWENPQPPFVMYGMQTEKKVEGGLKVRIHQLLVANEKTDRLYVITFESTATFWDAAWKIGDVLMTKFVLDEGV